MSPRARFLTVLLTVLLGSAVYFVVSTQGSTLLGLTLRSNLQLEQGLVGYWTFDEKDMAATTTAYDRSASGYNATASTTATSVSGEEEYGAGAPVNTSTGSYDFLVPQGVTSVTVKTWGAGGGAGGGASGGATSGIGAGGGFAQATIATTPGETLTVYVGGGGGGGPSGGTFNGSGGGGGGWSGVKRSATSLVIAGGGGGGGGVCFNAYDGGGGGAGGGTTGTAGTDGADSQGGDGGDPGSPTSAGIGGAGESTNGADGTGGSGQSGGAGGNEGSSPNNGGANGGVTGGGSGVSINCGGGGGAGGYYGGGGGEAGDDNIVVYGGGAGGGGGSSYASGTASSTIAGSGTAAANTGDSDYAGGAGAGVNGTTTDAGGAGTNGRTVLSYTGVGTGNTQPQPGALGRGVLLDHAFFDIGAAYNSVKSIAFWLKTSSSSQYLVDLNGSAYLSLSSWSLNANGFSSPTVYVDGVVTSTLPSDGAWHHVVVATSTGVNASDMDIGRVEGVGFADAAFDDVRIYSTTLSAAEVKRMYELGATTKVGVSLASQVDRTGLVGYWSFDGKYVDISSSTREILDQSGQGNHGDWKNHATTTVPGAIGQAVWFDGSNDYVSITGFNQTLLPATFTAWVFLTSYDSYDGIIFSRGAAVTGMSITPSQTLGYNWNDDSNTYYWTGGPTVPLNQWVFVAMVVESTQATAYVGSGNSVTSAANVNAHTTSQLNALEVGRDSYDAARSLMGAVDDVRVYNRALTYTEVTRLYGLGATTRIGVTLPSSVDKTGGLLGHWSFDGSYVDISSSTREILDRSGQGNNGDWKNHATTTVPGTIGQALWFDGSNDYVDTALTQIGVSSYSIGAWVKIPRNAANAATVIQDRGGGSGQSVTLGVDGVNGCGSGLGCCGALGSCGSASMRPLFGIESNSVFIGLVGPTAINDDTWHHLVGVWSGGGAVTTSQLTLYLDGTALSTEGITFGSISAPLTGSGTSKIGYHEAWNSYLLGSLDDVRVYNRALTYTEVTRLYGLGK